MVFCQARSRVTSSRSAREAANDLPRRSSGRFCSSQARTSLRNASSCSVKSKFIQSILGGSATASIVAGSTTEQTIVLLGSRLEGAHLALPHHTTTLHV